jgi:ATP-binding cassette, subfamily B, bacterial MsbA
VNSESDSATKQVDPDRASGSPVSAPAAAPPAEGPQSAGHPNRLEDIRRVVSAVQRLLVAADVRPASLVSLLVAMFFATFLEGLGVGLMIPLFGLIVTPDVTNTHAVEWVRWFVPGQVPTVYVALFALAIVGAICLKNVFSVWSAARIARVQRDMTVHLRRRLYRRLEQASLFVFDRTSTGALSSLFGHEIPRSVGVLGAVLALVQLSIMGSIYVGMLAWISVPLAFCVLVLGVVIGVGVRLFGRRLEDMGREVTSANLNLFARLNEAFAGIRTTRVSNAQTHERDRVEEVSRAQAVAEEHQQKSHAALQPLIESLAVVAAMLLVAAADLWLVVPGRMTATALMGFGLVLLRMLPLAKAFYGTQAQLSYGAGGADALLQWLQTAQYPSRPFGSRSARTLEDALVVDSLDFSYDSSRHALRSLSLTVKAHQFVAVVGRSGSGKSTLAALLLRMYEPESGHIYVDGIDHWEFTSESWHRLVAFVEQSPFVFNDTVAANVAYGVPDASLGDILKALETAQLDDFLAELPDGINTELGERGVMMSGGQRQRLAIARAIVRNPQLLILDEATSHLDTISESRLQRALLEAARGRTTIVIAHRLSTIQHADHIVVMDAGRVVDEGRWSDLQNRRGVFEELLSHDLRHDPGPHAVSAPR